MIWWAVSFIGWRCIYTVLTLCVTMPEAIARMRRTGGPMAAIGPTGMRTFTTVTALFSLLMYLVFPVCVLIFYRQPKVVAAFEKQE
jgi:hypothetical protein